MRLNDKAIEFVNAIKATAEFAELKLAKATIDKNKALRSELEEFNKKQQQLLETKMSAKEAETRTAELNKKFGSLSKIPEVEKYLEASRQFGSMMSNVYKTINESIDSELKFK